MRRFVRENGLTVVMLSAFAVALLGQSFAGWASHAAEQKAHGAPPLNYWTYLSTGHFWEGVFENWESEFLQMGAYVVLLVRLRQKGSSESRMLEGYEPVDEDPRQKQGDPNAPWPVRRGGWVLRIYERSLSLAFVLLFLASFVMHGLTGLAKLNEEHLSHGEPPVSFGRYLLGPSSGTSHCKTGRVNSWQWARWFS